jgi:hypothetical protein
MSEKIYIRSCKTVRTDGTVVITPWRQVVKVKVLDPAVKELNKQIRLQKTLEKRQIKKQAQLEEKNKIKEIKNQLNLLIDKMSKDEMVSLISKLQQLSHAPEKA